MTGFYATAILERAAVNDKSAVQRMHSMTLPTAILERAAVNDKSAVQRMHSMTLPTAILERAAVNDKINNLEKSRDMWRYMYAEVKKDSVNKDKMIAEKDKMIAEKDKMIAEKDWITAERDETIIKLKADITHLERRHEKPAHVQLNGYGL